MKKNEKVKISFLGLKYEAENPTSNGIKILISVLIFLSLLVISFLINSFFDTFTKH